MPEIGHPLNKITARDPQFELYTRLREAGVEVRAEYKLPATSNKSPSGYFYADLAVFRKGKLVAICECKRYRRVLAERQRENYEGAGVPYIVSGYETMDESFKWLEQMAWPNG